MPSRKQSPKTLLPLPGLSGVLQVRLEGGQTSEIGFSAPWGFNLVIVYTQSPFVFTACVVPAYSIDAT